MEPIILLTNDDGVDSPGLLAMASALADLGQVWVVAPGAEQSCVSHSLSLKSPIRVKRLRERVFAVDGKPADAVLIGLGDLLPRRPSLCVSGINRGYNLGTDVYYSGTVAGAREAAFAGIKALAVSVEREKEGVQVPDEAINWEAGARLGLAVCRKILGGDLEGLLWNLNVPNLPPGDIKGIRITRAGKREYGEVLKKNGDGTYSICGSPRPRGERQTDIWWVLRGYASLTPMATDPTERNGLERASGALGPDPS